VELFYEVLEGVQSASSLRRGKEAARAQASEVNKVLHSYRSNVILSLPFDLAKHGSTNSVSTPEF